MLLKTELKRIIFNPLVIVCIIVSVIFQIYSVYNEFLPHINSILAITSNGSINNLIDMVSIAEELNTYDGWIIGFKGYIISIIFLSCIPFSYSYIVDKKSGFIKNIQARSSKRKYIISKVICNSVIGGLIPVISSLISLIILLILFNNEIPSKLMPLTMKNGAFSEILFISPCIYIFITLAILFIIGGTYSMFSLAIGMITDKIIPCMLLPQIYWLAGSLMAEAGLSFKLAPWNIFYFWINPIYFKTGIIHTFIILIISIVIIYFKYKEELI